MLWIALYSIVQAEAGRDDAHFSTKIGPLAPV
jgi:hypothetical protein